MECSQNRQLKLVAKTTSPAKAGSRDIKRYWRGGTKPAHRPRAISRRKAIRLRRPSSMLRQWEEAQRLKPKDPKPAARALEVPPSWRKSLSAGVKREHLPLFPDDYDTVPTK
jgi:hypothetical protein